MGKDRLKSFYLDPELAKVLKIIAAMEDRSGSIIVNEALNTYLNSKYGEDVVEALKQCREPMEAVVIISVIQIKDGTPVDDTLLAGLERSVDRERL